MKEKLIYAGIVLLSLAIPLTIRACQAKYVYDDMKCLFAECRFNVDPRGEE